MQSQPSQQQIDAERERREALDAMNRAQQAQGALADSDISNLMADNKPPSAKLTNTIDAFAPDVSNASLGATVDNIINGL